MNVIAMLRSRIADRVSGIEELAVRLAKGESVPPDEVETVCDRCGATLEQLEEAVECHERRIELKTTAAGEAKAKAAIDAIERKRKPLADAAEAAEARLRAFDAEAGPTLAVHTDAVRAAWHANAQLIIERNLRPPALRALRHAQAAYADADRAESAARRAVADAERSLADGKEVASHNVRHADRTIPEHVEALRRDETMIATRGRLIEQAKAALVEATAATARARDELRTAEEAARRS